MQAARGETRSDVLQICQDSMARPRIRKRVGHPYSEPGRENPSTTYTDRDGAGSPCPVTV